PVARSANESGIPSGHVPRRVVGSEQASAPAWGGAQVWTPGPDEGACLVRSLRFTVLAALALVAAAAPAHANDFVSNRRSDWYRYTGPGGQEVRSQIIAETGGWRLWDEFGGFGPAWVFTYDSLDWFWIFDGRD